MARRPGRQSEEHANRTPSFETTRRTSESQRQDAYRSNASRAKLTSLSMPDIFIWAPEDEGETGPVCAFSSRFSLPLDTDEEEGEEEYDSDDSQPISPSAIVPRRNAPAPNSTEVSDEDVIAWTREILQSPVLERPKTPVEKPKTFRTRATSVLRSLGLMKKQSSRSSSPSPAVSVSPRESEEADTSPSHASPIGSTSTVMDAELDSRRRAISVDLPETSHSTIRPRRSSLFSFTHRNKSTSALTQVRSQQSDPAYDSAGARRPISPPMMRSSTAPPIPARSRHVRFGTSPLPRSRSPSPEPELPPLPPIFFSNTRSARSQEDIRLQDHDALTSPTGSVSSASVQTPFDNIQTVPARRPSSHAKLPSLHFDTLAFDLGPY